MSEFRQLSGADALLAFCQRTTRNYPGVKVQNWTTSWIDGLAFCAIAHAYAPKRIDYANLSAKMDHAESNLDLAFRVLEEELGVYQLLDAEDIGDKPDKRSMMTYLATMCQELQKHSQLVDKPPGPPKFVDEAYARITEIETGSGQASVADKWKANNGPGSSASSPSASPFSSPGPVRRSPAAVSAGKTWSDRQAEVIEAKVAASSGVSVTATPVPQSTSKVPVYAGGPHCRECTRVLCIKDYCQKFEPNLFKPRVCKLCTHGIELHVDQGSDEENGPTFNANQAKKTKKTKKTKKMKKTSSRSIAVEDDRTRKLRELADEERREEEELIRLQAEKKRRLAELEEEDLREERELARQKAEKARRLKELEEEERVEEQALARKLADKQQRLRELEDEERKEEAVLAEAKLEKQRLLATEPSSKDSSFLKSSEDETQAKRREARRAKLEALSSSSADVLGASTVSLSGAEAEEFDTAQKRREERRLQREKERAEREQEEERRQLQRHQLREQRRLQREAEREREEAEAEARAQARAQAREEKIAADSSGAVVHTGTSAPLTTSTARSSVGDGLSDEIRRRREAEERRAEADRERRAEEREERRLQRAKEARKEEEKIEARRRERQERLARLRG